MPAGSIARPATRSVGASDGQPVMVLPDLAGWPSMSIPVAAELPLLVHRGVDSLDGIAHLLPGVSCGGSHTMLWLLLALKFQFQQYL
jgi:hypothetical protein